MASCRAVGIRARAEAERNKAAWRCAVCSVWRRRCAAPNRDDPQALRRPDTVDSMGSPRRGVRPQRRPGDDVWPATILQRPPCCSSANVMAPPKVKALGAMPMVVANVARACAAPPPSGTTTRSVKVVRIGVAAGMAFRPARTSSALRYLTRPSSTHAKRSLSTYESRIARSSRASTALRYPLRKLETLETSTTAGDPKRCRGAAQPAETVATNTATSTEVVRRMTTGGRGSC